MSDLLKNVTTGLKNTLKFKNGVSMSHMGTVVSVATNTVVDRFHLGDFSSAEYLLTVDFASNKKESMQVRVVARPGEASVTVQSRTTIDDEIIILSGNVTDSYFELIASPANNNFHGARLTFFANYSETAIPIKVAAVRGSTTQSPSVIANTGNVVFQPVISNTGFKSPNFSVTTTGAVSVNSIASTTSISAASITATTSIKVNGNDVLALADLTTLPATFVNSSLTSVGTLTSLTVNHNTNLILSTANGRVVISNQSLTPGAIDGINIGATTPGTGNFTTGSFDTVTVSTAPTLVNQVTRKDYVDRTAAALAIALGA